MRRVASGVRLAELGHSGGRAGRNDSWSVYLYGMSRIGTAVCWHLSIVGRRGVHTLTVTRRDAEWTLDPPDALVGAVRAWLAAEPRGRRTELVEL